MAHITTDMIKAAYREAKDVYLNKQRAESARDKLVKNYKMNKSSAEYYIQVFKQMMDGKVYKRTISAKATEYFFESILLDFGSDKLKTALNATEAHANYYEKLPKGANPKKIRALINKYKKKLSSQTPELPEEASKNKTYSEGVLKRISVNAYERNSKARAKCIEHHGCECMVCGFNFETVYGEIGKGYIHVHHLKPLSEIQEGYKIDPVKELVPVCPNCHVMLHKLNPPYTIQHLQDMLSLKQTIA